MPHQPEFQDFHLDTMERANHNAETSTIASIEYASQTTCWPCISMGDDVLLGQVEELRAENQPSSESSRTIGRSRGASIASSHQLVVTDPEFVRWNEEAVSRCTLFSSQVNYSSLLYVLCRLKPIHHLYLLPG